MSKPAAARWMVLLRVAVAGIIALLAWQALPDPPPPQAQDVATLPSSGRCSDVHNLVASRVPSPIVCDVVAGWDGWADRDLACLQADPSLPAPVLTCARQRIEG